jgi:hypothetical protein
MTGFNPLPPMLIFEGKKEENSDLLFCRLPIDHEFFAGIMLLYQLAPLKAAEAFDDSPS